MWRWLIATDDFSRIYWDNIKHKFAGILQIQYRTRSCEALEQILASLFKKRLN